MNSLLLVCSAPLASAFGTIAMSSSGFHGAEATCIRVGKTLANVSNCAQSCGMPEKLCSFHETQNRCTCSESIKPEHQDLQVFEEHLCIRHGASAANASICSESCEMKEKECRMTDSACVCTAEHKKGLPQTMPEMRMPEMPKMHMPEFQMPEMNMPEMPPMPMMPMMGMGGGSA